MGCKFQNDLGAENRHLIQATEILCKTSISMAHPVLGISKLNSTSAAEFVF